MADAAADVVVGLVWLATGSLVWKRGAQPRTGVLMVATGAAWLVGSVAEALVFLHRGPMAHTLLAYPAGVLGAWPERLVVSAAYVGGAILPVGRSPVVTLVLVALIAAAAAWRSLRVTGAVRRSRLAPLAAAAAISAVLAVGAVVTLAGGSLGVGLLWVYEGVLVATALGLLADLRAGRWAEAAVTGLVVDLGEGGAGGTLSEKLARAVGDASLTVAYALDDATTYVDERGRPLVLPGPGSGRVVTRVEEDGRPVAALVHDPAALRDRALLDGAASALRVAVANARLQAGVRARLAEVEGSRRRLLGAADAQRRRLAAELDAEVMSRLDDAARTLAGAGERDELLDELDCRLGEVRDQLRRFTLGLRPALLDERGLATAVRTLVAGAPLAVHVAVPSGRFPKEVEATAWFVCSEALANVIKHARATRVEVRVEHTGRQLRVEVIDDGTGGADPERGSGLRGLAARVEALGGVLSVGAGVAGGTRLVAELPSPPPVEAASSS